MTPQESDVKIIASRSPSFDGSIETNSDPVQTLQKELDRDISGLMQSGHNFRLGGHKQSFGGARPRYAPP